jgi:phenylacetic acid degradation operon negative regulatory protein
MPARPPAARSLLVTVFGDAVAPHGGRVWLGSLIRLLAPFGVSERLVRTSVFRLTKEKWLRPEAAGRRTDYVLTGPGRRQFEAATRHIYAATRPAWDGRWRIVIPLPGTKNREQLKRTLLWQGFGELNGVFLHPSAEPVIEDRTDLLIVVGEPSASGDVVASAWDLDELSKEYAAFVRRFARARPPARPQEAFVLRTHLVHEYRRLLLRDPELPDELLPKGWQGVRAHEICAGLYKLLVPASEQHLRSELRTADGAYPPALPEFRRRFSGG